MTILFIFNTVISQVNWIFGKSQKDDYLKELGIEEYWKLESDTADWKEFGHDTLLIMEVVWTKKLGLTKYIKRNKEVFTTIR